MNRLLPALAVGCMLMLAGCASTDGISAAYHVATSASVTRNQAITVAATIKTLQDVATTSINGCVAAKTFAGPCAPNVVEAVHKALVASRGPRDALLSFADQHAGKELGASGLYDAAVNAKDNLLSVLKQYGIAVPASAS
jgi:hypothetical protein